MVIRPVFVSKNGFPYYSTVNVEFVYNSGFAMCQKRKNIAAIHRAFCDKYRCDSVLEVSSKSLEDVGVRLSAFNLTKYVPFLGKSVAVENIYQGSKKFTGGGPFTDLYEVSPKEAKRDERLKSSGKLVSFCYEGKEYPLVPNNIFYDWIYINTLLEHEDLWREAVCYTAFTDIEFNPEKSANCQARAMAIFVSLVHNELLGKVKEFDDFISLFVGNKRVPNSPRDNSSEKDEMKINCGDMIVHKVWGRGTVIQSGNVLTVQFDGVGEKRIGKAWTMENCEIVSCTN